MSRSPVCVAPEVEDGLQRPSDFRPVPVGSSVVVWVLMGPRPPHQMCWRLPPEGGSSGGLRVQGFGVQGSVVLGTKIGTEQKENEEQDEKEDEEETERCSGV